MTRELISIVQQGEIEAGFASPDETSAIANVSTDGSRSDADYQRMFERLTAGLPPEDKPEAEQSNTALLIMNVFREKKAIKSWQDIKKYELAIEAAFKGKKSVPLAEVVSSSPVSAEPAPVQAAPAPAPPEKKKAKKSPAQQELWMFTDNEVQEQLTKTAANVLKNETAILSPVLSASFLEKAGAIAIQDAMSGIGSPVDVLR
jgi:hypothetical protein